MSEVKCNFCGSGNHEEKRTEYLYSYKDKYLLVPNTPVDICRDCGMLYYDVKVLKEIERKFFAIHDKDEKPDRYIEIPTVVYK